MTENILINEKNAFLENFKIISERFNRAVHASGRNEGAVILLAATKTVDAKIIDFACENGIKLFGENRVQEYLSKLSILKTTVPRHFIGTLQTNKVKDIVGKVDMIQSVDSVTLARFISERTFNTASKATNTPFQAVLPAIFTYLPSL